MRLYYIGCSHTRGFSFLLGKKALTHNKNRKIESTRVERHYKRTGGVVSGPRLPPHQASPRSKREKSWWGLLGGGWEYISVISGLSCRSQRPKVIEDEGNTTGTAGPLQSALAVNGPVMRGVGLGHVNDDGCWGGAVKQVKGREKAC